jgi:hypothetical protein
MCVRVKITASIGRLNFSPNTMIFVSEMEIAGVAQYENSCERRSIIYNIYKGDLETLETFYQSDQNKRCIWPHLLKVTPDCGARFDF